MSTSLASGLFETPNWFRCVGQSSWLFIRCGDTKSFGHKMIHHNREVLKYILVQKVKYLSKLEVCHLCTETHFGKD